MFSVSCIWQAQPTNFMIWQRDRNHHDFCYTANHRSCISGGIHITKNTSYKQINPNECREIWGQKNKNVGHHFKRRWPGSTYEYVTGSGYTHYPNDYKGHPTSGCHGHRDALWHALHDPSYSVPLAMRCCGERNLSQTCGNAFCTCHGHKDLHCMAFCSPHASPPCSM